ncbi:hypothetical protein AAVH_20080 [Aphelenchoides avenae]|nr:hypothetical protein AAVH_20080 [Aphelenchus avenae]
MTHFPQTGHLMATFFLLAVYRCSDALSCFQSDENGEVTLVSNATWTYCATIPAFETPEGLSLAKLYGYGPAENLADTYNTVFSQSASYYKVMSLCTYSEYDLHQVAEWLPKQKQYIFKCVCNYDQCNQGATLAPYLASLKARELESMGL